MNKEQEEDFERFIEEDIRNRNEAYSDFFGCVWGFVVTVAILALLSILFTR